MRSLSARAKLSTLTCDRLMDRSFRQARLARHPRRVRLAVGGVRGSRRSGCSLTAAVTATTAVNGRDLRALGGVSSLLAGTDPRRRTPEKRLVIGRFRVRIPVPAPFFSQVRGSRLSPTEETSRTQPRRRHSKETPG